MIHADKTVVMFPRATKRTSRKGTGSSGSASPAVIAAVAVLVMGLIGGIWWFKAHRSDPKENALKVYKAMLSCDWETAYQYMDKLGEKNPPPASVFNQRMVDLEYSSPARRQAMDMMRATYDHHVGEPVFEGEEAVVPASCKVSYGGEKATLRGKVRMIKRDGIWLLKVGQSAEANNDYWREMLGQMTP